MIPSATTSPAQRRLPSAADTAAAEVASSAPVPAAKPDAFGAATRSAGPSLVGAPSGASSGALAKLLSDIAKIKATLPSLTHEQVAALDLKPCEDQSFNSGSKVKYKVEGHTPAGEYVKFLLRPSDEKGLDYERELFATTLRGRVGLPAVRVTPYTLKTPQGEVKGYVKPWVSSGKGDLCNDWRQWSALQRSMLLMDHVTTLVLGNDDMKPAQSAVVELDSLDQPGLINLDWNNTFFAYKYDVPLDRFANRPPHPLNPFLVTPPTHNILYQAYVHGEVDLSFEPMLHMAQQIQSIPDPEFKAMFQPFADAAFANGASHGLYATKEDFVAAVMAKKNTLVPAVTQFIDQLKDERRRYAAGEKPSHDVRSKDRELTRSIEHLDSELYRMKGDVKRFFAKLM